MKLKVTRSSGNVFRDIGFARNEAEHLLVRADLLIKVQKLIESKRLKPAELVKTLRIPGSGSANYVEAGSICLAPTRSSTYSLDWESESGSSSRRRVAV
jgi:predicted XRE-type DNA-binding protein